MANKKKDYEVGYGKPPRHSQFQRGHTGSGGGRKKDSQNLKTIVLEVMGQTVNVNGKLMSKKRATILRLTTDAINGKSSAMKQLLDLMTKFEVFVEAEKEVVADLLDQAAMERGARRILAKAEAEKAAASAKAAPEVQCETKPSEAIMKARTMNG